MQLTPGKHLALAMIPVGGATKRHPALFVIPGTKGQAPVAIVSYSTPPPGGAPTAGAGSAPGAAGSGTTSSAGGGTRRHRRHASATGAPSTPGTTTPTPTEARAFPFTLPSTPGPGGTQALAENTTNGGVTYDVAYSVVTVNNGAPVTNTNSAYALAHCQSCTTVAVSFQIVLIVGQSKDIAPDQRRRLAQLRLPGVHDHGDRRPACGDAQSPNRRQRCWRSSMPR